GMTRTRCHRSGRCALREKACEVLIVDDIPTDQQAARDVIAEVSPARPRPPASDCALAAVPYHDQIRLHLLGVNGDLPRRLTDDELARGLETERRKPCHAFLQYTLVFDALLCHAAAAHSLAKLGARRLSDDRQHEDLRAISPRQQRPLAQRRAALDRTVVGQENSLVHRYAFLERRRAPR